MVIVHRFFGNPITSYIDLIFLANISIVILDDQHSGHYLHGRNHMQQSGEAAG